MMSVPSKAASRSRTFVQAALLAVVLAAIRLMTLRANLGIHGDFFATLPGAYVETLNPALWNSPDLRAAWGFHQRLYFYGPAQYLTLYPIALMSSYRQIAIALSLVYAGVIAGALYLISRVVRPEERGLRPVVVVLALLFAPLLQAYAHVEFEVIVLLVLVAATYLLVRRRELWAGALLGYIAWFKIWPIAFFGLFLVKRQFKAAAGFALATVITLGAGQMLFGLDRFILFNPSLARSLPQRDFFLRSLVTPMQVSFDVDPRNGPGDATGDGFCKGWVRSNETYVSARWGMCGLMFNHGWLGGVIVFYGVCLMLGLLALMGFAALERRHDLDPAAHRRRTILEMSLLVTGASLTLIAHYYYFIFLILPISLLAYRYVDRGSWIKLGLLGSAYVVLGGIVAPFWLISRSGGIIFWRVYAGHSVYLYGMTVVTGLLMWEYLSLGFGRDSS